MSNIPLDIYDDMPIDMKRYITNYGWHFNKKAHDYAVGLMQIKDKVNNTNVKLKPYTKEEIDKLLQSYGVVLENNVMYDYMFVANMCKADYYGKSIPDDYRLCLYIKDTIDDVDASNETTFRRWVATMIGNGNPIDWYDIV